MTAPAPSDNSFQLDQAPFHFSITAKTGSGKSILVLPKLLEELQKQTHQAQG